MTKIRTRFAPSPTGRMHVGNLRTALYAYLIAKHEDGDFILRIEDTDQERYMEGAVDIIYRTMKNTGLLHDEGPDKDGGVGPYVQSERQASGLYLKYAKQLIEQGDAYYCFCGPEELESMKRVVAGKEISIYDKRCLHLSKEEVQKRLDAGEPHVIRFNMPTEGTTTFHDVIYGDITVNNEEMEDLILIKSDGYPTYNFANVVDDHLMGITHVVRGNEYLSSAPKYNRIYEAFGWDIPTYVHCPLITNEEHQKLSKRSGHSSYEDLLEQGFVTEAIVNFVALLGWSPQDNCEIFSLPELVKAFDYHHISKSPAVFDITKLRWMNGEYIKKMDPEEQFFIKHTTNLTRAKIDKIRYKVNVNTLEQSAADALELNEIARVIFTTGKPLFFDPYSKNKNTGAFILIDPITNNTCAVGMIIDKVERKDMQELEIPEISLSKLDIGSEHFTAIEKVVKELDRQGITVKIIQ